MAKGDIKKIVKEINIDGVSQIAECYQIIMEEFEDGEIFKEKAFDENKKCIYINILHGRILRNNKGERDDRLLDKEYEYYKSIGEEDSYWSSPCQTGPSSRPLIHA